jgi:hypothetical protein
MEGAVRRGRGPERANTMFASGGRIPFRYTIQCIYSKRSNDPETRQLHERRLVFL